MSSLASQRCAPCRGDVPPLSADEIRPLHAQTPSWVVAENRLVAREFRFRDFAAALKFVDRIGALAEAEGHHPELRLAWGFVRVELWTHAVHGLTPSDFILAAKIDGLWRDAAGRVV